MTEKNTSDAPTWWTHYINAFLTALHVLVVVISMVAHPPIDNGADRTLP